MCFFGSLIYLYHSQNKLQFALTGVVLLHPLFYLRLGVPKIKQRIYFYNVELFSTTLSKLAYVQFALTCVVLLHTLYYLRLGAANIKQRNYFYNVELFSATLSKLQFALACVVLLQVTFYRVFRYTKNKATDLFLQCGVVFGNILCKKLCM